MAIALKKRLRGHKGDIALELQTKDIETVMEMYGVKTRASFRKYLKEVGIKWENTQPLANLSGGQKQMWIRQHRELILNYYWTFGEEATLRHFTLTDATLDTILRFSDKTHRVSLTTMQRIKLDIQDLKFRIEQLEKGKATGDTKIEMAILARREETKEVRETRESYYQFTNLVSSQISKGIGQFIKLMIERGLTPDNALPPPEIELDVETILSSINGGNKTKFLP
jgi:ABC-type methionine transport system ATPase subunit